MMMRTTLLAAFAMLALLGLGACNSSPVAQVPATAPGQQARLGMPRQDFQMPAGSGCAGDIARYRAVAKSDADSGNVNQSVYNQIDGEIRGAESACAAGNDAQARALIHASKARHGYPGG